MPRVTLRTTSSVTIAPHTSEVLGDPPVHPDSEVVGAGDQWDDADDDTYVVLGSNTDGTVFDWAAVSIEQLDLDEVPSESVSAVFLDLRVRWDSGTQETGVLEARMRLLDSPEVDDVVLVPSSSGSTNPIGVTDDLEYPGYYYGAGDPDMIAIAEALADPDSTLTIYTYFPAAGEHTMTVYELSVIVEYENLLPPVTTAHHGSNAIRFVADDAPEPEEEVAPPVVFVEGPDSEVHHGAFGIPYSRRVSSQVQLTSEDPCWVWPAAHFLIWDGSDFIEGSVEFLGVPTRVVPQAWTAHTIDADAVEGHTHWRLGLHVFEEDPRVDLVLGWGHTIYAECAYVPDNGLPLYEEPYLDGDQPGAEWEGQLRLSTSVYKAAEGPGVLVLGEGLVLENYDY